MSKNISIARSKCCGSVRAMDCDYSGRFRHKYTNRGYLVETMPEAQARKEFSKSKTFLDAAEAGIHNRWIIKAPEIFTGVKVELDSYCSECSGKHCDKCRIQKAKELLK